MPKILSVNSIVFLVFYTVSQLTDGLQTFRVQSLCIAKGLSGEVLGIVKKLLVRS